MTKNYLFKKDLLEEIKDMNASTLIHLADIVRAYIIEVLSSNPGHLGASLGCVELAVTIHHQFDIRNNSLVWDVGHQAYAHKILTGRAEEFKTIRTFTGISGFPSLSESPLDYFGTGHSSTSISAVLGMALSSNSSEKLHIAVIGDGALTGGMSFEALNHLSTTDANVLVILNDNNMSIDPNVGGLQNHFNTLDNAYGENYFKILGLPYFGVYDGNDIEVLNAVLKDQVNIRGPRVLHVRTKKGFGYNPAIQGNPTVWHAPGKFAIETGSYLNDDNTEVPITYQDAVGNTLLNLGVEEDSFHVITPAMASGSRLLDFAKEFPSRLHDVGIAEQHAVTLAAGMSAAGKKAYAVIYSTFLQRAYDQVIHDVCLQKLAVTFLIDRAGLVGHDGATHHGAFDLMFLVGVPNVQIYVPYNEEQLAATIKYTHTLELPVAIRYPRGRGVLAHFNNSAEFIPFEWDKNESQSLIISFGPITNTIKEVLAQKDLNYDLLIIQDFTALLNSVENQEMILTYKIVISFEDGVALGGLGSYLLSFLSSKYQAVPRFTNKGLPNKFIKHGSPEELYASVALDFDGIHDTLKTHSSRSK